MHDDTFCKKMTVIFLSLCKEKRTDWSFISAMIDPVVQPSSLTLSSVSFYRQSVSTTRVYYECALWFDGYFIINIIYIHFNASIYSLNYFTSVCVSVKENSFSWKRNANIGHIHRFNVKLVVSNA